MLFKILTILPLYYLVLTSNISSPPTFIDPLNIPISISGSFGELRTSNFHSGIDIKTYGKTGYDVFAIADGFISRIFVSSVGYGKALYISHDNGYTSVYAHLDGFGIQIEEYIRAKQYESKSYYVNIFPDSELMRIKQGDVIGYSGNSGSSMGPHLHFEVRETSTQETINPMLFNFNILDTIEPIFHNLYLYQFGTGSSFNRSAYSMVKQSKEYRLKDIDTIVTYGTIGLAAHVTDRINGSNNVCGINQLKVEVNNKITYMLNLSKISFSEVKYIQSHSDYWLVKNQNRRIHKCFVNSGNRFSNYSNLINNGYLNIAHDSIYNVTITSYDGYKNSSQMSFVIKGDHKAKKYFPKMSHIQQWSPNITNVYNDEFVTITASKNALYDTLYFNYSILNQTKDILTKRYLIGDSNTALHQNINVKIKNIKIPENLIKKLVTVEVSEKTMSVLDTKPKYNGIDVETNISTFGTIAFTCDTTPPKIIPINIHNGIDITSLKSIKFKITDDLSGINNYDGYINDKWILFEYDAKNNLLVYNIDKQMPTGSDLELRIEITDKVGNKATKYIQLAKPV
ncbi:MAG: M23 family metallopeptidase [Salinivirgaceae bacterium]|nr:M23 family metallopeptidase [Salinivirgaceae bacterium]MDD4748225.1 M23 family metallopeptidase [Salinivirgaceae bacterium]MDY0279695.1 M23 family metallopeptidase [Salinivirgaceae bacterium]